MPARLPKIAVLTILAVMILSACAPAATPAPTNAPEPTTAIVPTEIPQPQVPDLTGKTITFYALSDLSGAYASVSGPLVTGTKDMVDYINKNGGIFGAQIEARYEDTGGKIDQSLTIYERYKSQDNNILILLLFNTPDAQALRDFVKEDKIPTMLAAPDDVSLYGTPDGWEFSMSATYPDQFGYFLDFIKANWATIKPANAGDEIKLAYVSWPTALGQAALTDKTKAYMEQLGIKLVASETYEMSPQADTTTALLNAQAAGANVIYNNTFVFGVANLLNDLKELGIRDQFVVGTDMIGMDRGAYAFLPDPANATGLYVSFPFAWWSDTDNPGIQLALKLHTMYNREEVEKSFTRLVALASADTAKHALEQAILKVGFENLTGQAVYDALTQMKDYPVMGGLFKADYTGGKRAGNLLSIRQVQGGPDNFPIVKDFGVATELTAKP